MAVILLQCNCQCLPCTTIGHGCVLQGVFPVILPIKPSRICLIFKGMWASSSLMLEVIAHNTTHSRKHLAALTDWRYMLVQYVWNVSRTFPKGIKLSIDYPSMTYVYEENFVVSYFVRHLTRARKS